MVPVCHKFQEVQINDLLCALVTNMFRTDFELENFKDMPYKQAAEKAELQVERLIHICKQRRTWIELCEDFKKTNDAHEKVMCKHLDWFDNKVYDCRVVFMLPKIISMAKNFLAVRERIRIDHNKAVKRQFHRLKSFNVFHKPDPDLLADLRTEAPAGKEITKSLTQRKRTTAVFKRANSISKWRAREMIELMGLESKHSLGPLGRRGGIFGKEMKLGSFQYHSVDEVRQQNNLRSKVRPQSTVTDDGASRPPRNPASSKGPLNLVAKSPDKYFVIKEVENSASHVSHSGIAEDDGCESEIEREEVSKSGVGQGEKNGVEAIGAQESLDKRTEAWAEMPAGRSAWPASLPPGKTDAGAIALEEEKIMEVEEVLEAPPL